MSISKISFAGAANLTRDGTTGATATKMVDNCRITLDGAVDGQIGAIAGIGDFLVFKYAQGSFDSFGG